MANDDIKGAFAALQDREQAEADARGVPVESWQHADYLAKMIDWNGRSKDMGSADDWWLTLDDIGWAAKEHGMSELVKQTGLSRAGLYRALSVNGAPSFETVARALWHMGLQITVKPHGRIPPRVTRKRFGDRAKRYREDG